MLRIGDIVSLRHAKPLDGFLTGEGIIIDDCWLCKASDSFEECLWEIYVQNQYSAQRDLEEAEALGLGQSPADVGDNSSEVSDADESEEQLSMLEQERSLLEHLRKAVANEKRLNEKLMAMKIGKPVSFGDILQLKHVKSGAFLTVSMTTLAKHEQVVKLSAISQRKRRVTFFAAVLLLLYRTDKTWKERYIFSCFLDTMLKSSKSSASV